MNELEIQAEVRRLLRDVGLCQASLQVLADDAAYFAERIGLQPRQATPTAPPMPVVDDPTKSPDEPVGSKKKP